MATSILTERQIAFLQFLGREQGISQSFYLSGGTALAGFYLQHRYSEDLDFFNEQEFGVEGLNVFLKRIRPVLQYTAIDYQQSYNRNLFFLSFSDREVLKTEFTYFPFPRIEAGIVEYGIHIDSLIDIAVNKLFTIYQQIRARDFIDLYFIFRQEDWTVADLVKKAKAKFDWHIDPLQLGTQFIKVTEAKDYPRLVKNVDSSMWQDFFLEEAKKLKSSVLE